jgi:hypothetical protein
MKELTYLLQELGNWDKNKAITVEDLKKMIEKCIKNENKKFMSNYFDTTECDIY